MAPRHEALDDGEPPRKAVQVVAVRRAPSADHRHLSDGDHAVGFLIAPNVIVTVPTGHVGVLWKRFRGGTQLDPRLLKEEGLRVLLPWDKLFLYDLRLQTTTDTYNAISKDGVNLAATINIRFRLKHDAIPQLHQVDRPELTSRSWCARNRQPRARDHRRIHCRRGLFDQSARKFRSRSAPTPRRCWARA